MSLSQINGQFFDVPKAGGSYIHLIVYSQPYTA